MKKHPISRRTRLRAAGLALAAAAVLAARADAITINWGDNFGGVDIQSSGIDIYATFTFQIGTFGSFVPDETNTDLWAANWTVLDTANYNGGIDFFSSSFQLEADLGMPGNVISSSTGESVAIGEQVYIWVYSSDTPGFAVEMALITDNDGLGGNDWTIPDPGAQSSEPLDWRVSTATDPVFGGLNDVRGPGQYTATPPIFDLQTATFVPEPSSALLVLAGLGLLGRHRRRGSGTNTRIKP